MSAGGQFTIHMKTDNSHEKNVVSYFFYSHTSFKSQTLTYAAVVFGALCVRLADAYVTNTQVLCADPYTATRWLLRRILHHITIIQCFVCN